MSKIMVVEDNPEVAKLLELILRRAGYDVEISEDGIDALETFKQWQPDLVLLDIMLPRMDGYEVCSNIRHQLGSDAPVVMLSSLDSPLDIERSREVGATDYIAKPFEKDALLGVIAANIPVGR